MIDPKQTRERKIEELTKENEALREQVDRAQRELADSVRAEIELGAEIVRLRRELQELQDSLKSSTSPVSSTAHGSSSVNQTLFEHDHGV